MKNLIQVVSLLVLISNVVWAQKQIQNEKPFLDADMGFSGGSSNGSSYSEINLGINLNFTDWLTWRNSGFKRFGSNQVKDIIGLDSTVRLISTNHFNGGAFGLFTGAGYRFADPSEKNAFIAEAGLGLNIGRFGLGGGAKYLKYSKTQYDLSQVESKSDEVIYFISISGGGGFIF